MKIDKDFWTPEKIRIAAEMWARGAIGSEIADRIGGNADRVYAMMTRNREMFQARSSLVKEAPPVRVIPRLREDRVSDDIPKIVRYTSLGVPITMPRVTFIDGVA